MSDNKKLEDNEKKSETDTSCPSIQSLKVPKISEDIENCNNSEVMVEKIISPLNRFEYLIYYNRNPRIGRPMAVLFGTDWEQTSIETNKTFITQRDKFVKNKGFIRIEINTTEDVKRKLTLIKHSNNSLIVNIKTGSSAVICGETGDQSLTIGSKTIIKMMGNVVFFEKDGIKQLELSGRHTIDVILGQIYLVFCDENEILIISDKNNYLIDGESYLDSIQKYDKQTVSTQKTVKKSKLSSNQI